MEYQNSNIQRVPIKIQSEERRSPREAFPYSPVFSNEGPGVRSIPPKPNLTTSHRTVAEYSPTWKGAHRSSVSELWKKKCTTEEASCRDARSGHGPRLLSFGRSHHEMQEIHDDPEIKLYDVLRTMRDVLRGPLGSVLAD
ncbi:hypothetical protein N7457_003942 [Penicillium paradoxum]|uniref:uncharacterized protein n=1 Tax=Penicillium paradoxum TaxID=176176 RepID=UPI0025479A3B|nr:uncharacterized protein N7457_003942 [Penicillium paradoxum]KAJ5782168.1 hypothetical protein N7457_003942 [Penicillium paradoxum]